MDLESADESKDYIEVDDRHGFVNFLKIPYAHRANKLVKDVPVTNESFYCPEEYFYLVCIFDAIDCTKALLEGDPFIVDLNVPFEYGLYPLHIAAEAFSYDMIDLLLRHGAWTDVRTIEGEFRGDLLPLNIALEMLSYHRYPSHWTPKQSIFKLIVILSLPQMKVPLETNRLLAWNTKDVNNIFYHYAMEGKLIPLAALLLVAREKIMAPSMLSKDGSVLEGDVMIRQCILDKSALLDEEVELMCIGKKRNQKIKNKKTVMKMVLLLLEVFARTGDAIETYRQSVQYHMSKEKVVKDIKALLEESGFVLKDKDIDLSDIDCESEEIKLATEVLERRTSFRSQSQDLCMPHHSLSRSFRQSMHPITNKFQEQKWAMSKFIEWGSPVLSHERPCHTFHLMKDFYGFHLYRLARNKKMGKAMILSPAFFLYLKDYKFFASAIKHGITRI
ncbi:uncharacterized protein LOC132276076 [Cornus florida]|uniref:uncharacterized protein LOC132276076 n=1 Tax=Cornus florida TaxID=4283 RepID=UPI0028A0CEC4|nr:uncharacterized protein LOC132276076 [Cornus florida]